MEVASVAHSCSDVEGSVAHTCRVVEVASVAVTPLLRVCFGGHARKSHVKPEAWEDGIEYDPKQVSIVEEASADEEDFY